MSAELSVGDVVQAKIVSIGRILYLKERDGVAGALVRFTPIGEGFPIDVWCSLGDIDVDAPRRVESRHTFQIDCTVCGVNGPHEAVNWPGGVQTKVICPTP